jgi:hypothetical protein
MKKSKFLVLGLIALMLVGGLALASCDSDGRKCDSFSSCDHDANDTCGKTGCYKESRGNGCSC